MPETTHALPARLLAARDQQGRSAEELTQHAPGLLIFLRHGGCPFCRETLAQLQQHRTQLAERNVTPILIHLMNDADAAALFAQYAADDLPRISDPAGELFDAVGLEPGNFASFAGPQVWWKGFKTVVLSGHRPGVPNGDVRRLSGAFLVHRGALLLEHRAATSADQPPWNAILDAAAKVPKPERPSPPPPTTEQISR